MAATRRGIAVDTDPPVSRPHRGEARRADLGERLADVPPLAVFSDLAEQDARYRRAIAACPAEHRGWLTGVATDTLADAHERAARAAAGLIAPYYSDTRDADALFERIDCLGPIHGILAHWEQDRGSDYALVPDRIARKLAEQVLDDPNDPPAEMVAFALLAVACGEDADATARLARALDQGGHVAFLAAGYLATRGDRSMLTVSNPVLFAVAEVLLDALTRDWPDGLWGRNRAGRAADRAADELRGLPPGAFDRDRLRDALACYGGQRFAFAVELWWEAGGGYSDCPVSLHDVIHSDPWGWVRLYLSQSSEWFPADIHARTLATGSLTATGRDRPAFFEAVGAVRAAGLPATELLPALAGALADELDVEAHEELVGCWSDYRAETVAHPERWTAWDTWIASLLNQPLGGLSWLVFADWLEENGHPVAAAVARGDSDRTRVANGWRRLFAWVSEPAAPA